MPAVLDGVLSPREAADVREHLASCADCRKVYDRYREDSVALQRFLAEAPFLPLSDGFRREVEDAGRRRGVRHALAGGGHRLAAAVLMAGLVGVVMVGALAIRWIAGVGLYNGDSPTTTANSPTLIAMTSPAAETLVDDRPSDEMDQVFTTLESAGLVYPLDQMLVMAGRPVRLVRLATDRDVTFLEYIAPRNHPLDPDELLIVDSADRDYRLDTVGMGTADGAPTPEPSGEELTRFVAELPGIDPSAKFVTLRARLNGMDTRDFTVPVDLSRLRSLSDPRTLDASVSGNSVRITAMQLRRGFSVSTILLEVAVATSGSRTQAAVDAQSGATADSLTMDLRSVRAEIDGVPIPEVRCLRRSGAGPSALFAVRLYGQWDSGILSLTINELNITTDASGNGAPEGASWISGPWTLAVDLASGGTAPATTPSTPLPTPTATPAPATSVPADLFFLAGMPTGQTAIWVRSAETGQAMPVIVASSDITSFAVLPDATIAYTIAGPDTVSLSTLDGTSLGTATVPDGRPASVYAPSPDGTQVASVPKDRTALWVDRTAHSGPRMIWSVPNPETGLELIDNVTWSPDGSSLLVRRSVRGVAGPPIVMDANGTFLWEGEQAPIDITWSPDSRHLFFSTPEGVFRVDLDDGTTAEITPPDLEDGAERQYDHLTWLPDGRLAFVVTKGTSPEGVLWLVNSAGQNGWLVRADLGVVRDLVWTRTSRGYGFVVATEGASTSGQDTVALSPGLYFVAGVEPTIEPAPLTPAIDSQRFGQAAWVLPDELP